MPHGIPAGRWSVLWSGRFQRGGGRRRRAGADRPAPDGADRRGCALGRRRDPRRAQLPRPTDQHPGCRVSAHLPRRGGGTEHAVARMLGQLSGATVHRLTLIPLSLSAVVALAAGTARDGTAVHAFTEGNPFFVTEALAADGNAVSVTAQCERTTRRKVGCGDRTGHDLATLGR